MSKDSEGNVKLHVSKQHLGGMIWHHPNTFGGACNGCIDITVSEPLFTLIGSAQRAWDAAEKMLAVIAGLDSTITDGDALYAIEMAVKRYGAVCPECNVPFWMASSMCPHRLTNVHPLNREE